MSAWVTPPPPELFTKKLVLGMCLQLRASVDGESERETDLSSLKCDL